MLKTKLIQLYFYICEIYEEELKWHCQRFTKSETIPVFTDEEVITTYLFSMIYNKNIRIKDMHNYILNHWSDWFPNLPSYSAYNARINNLASVFAPLSELLLEESGDEFSTLGEQLMRLTDSMPIITCSGKRDAKVALELCDKGYNSTKGMYYHGVKLHGIGFYQKGKLPKIEVLQIS